MRAALILADHEGLYEFSRMSRAVAVAAFLAFLAIVVYRRVRPSCDRPWRSTAGRLALAGIGLAAVTIGLGIIPRETAGGYVICGPPLNLPASLPGFANVGGDARADSVHCDPLMAAPMWWLVIGLVGSVVLFGAARLVGPKPGAADT